MDGDKVRPIGAVPLVHPGARQFGCWVFGRLRQGIPGAVRSGSISRSKSSYGFSLLWRQNQSLDSGEIPLLSQTPNETWAPDPGSRVARRLVSSWVPSFPPHDSPPRPDFLHYNQALLRVDVTDVNDNGPQFNVSRPRRIAGVPYDAGYGFNVIRLQVGPQSARDTDVQFTSIFVPKEIRITIQDVFF